MGDGTAVGDGALVGAMVGAGTAVGDDATVATTVRAGGAVAAGWAACCWPAHPASKSAASSSVSLRVAFIKNLSGNHSLERAEEWENGGNHGIRSRLIAVRYSIVMQ